MPEPNLNFSFYVRGIEDEMLAVLSNPMKAIGAIDQGLYTGQLDDVKTLDAAIKNQSLRYPFLMVSYAGGTSSEDPNTGEVYGDPRFHRHFCTFSVIVADDNLQDGGTARRNQVYDMVSVVWDELVGLTLIKEVDGVDYVLNTVPFNEPENVPLVLPNATAMGVIFDIGFDWESPDRTIAGPTGNRIHLEVESKWPGLAESDTDVPPGVELEF